MEPHPTTMKHDIFVYMGQKDVIELVGIGQVLGERLTKEGYGKVYKVLRKFLPLGKNEQNFKAWL